MSAQSTEHKRLHAIISGRVQGVGFRHNTVLTARRLDLVGWVQNRPDGTVELVAEGPNEALQELLAFLHQGPRAARVEAVQTDWQPPSGQFDTFKVRYFS